MVASKSALKGRQSPNGMKKLKFLPKRGFDIIGCIQRLMARALMLDFQLDCLDYQTEGWYHADLDYETFEYLQVLLLFVLLHNFDHMILFIYSHDAQLLYLRRLFTSISIHPCCSYNSLRA